MSGLRLLLDMNLPPSLCVVLEESGYPATHVRDLGLQAATDEALVVIARAERLASGARLRPGYPTARRPARSEPKTSSRANCLG